jgi:3-phosphoshikimate 1-carboxyvinyltransferase
MSRSFIVRPSRDVGGSVQVPGDKSISHRAVMLGSLASGVTRISGFLPGEDCLATLSAAQAMGVKITQFDRSTLSIEGSGLHGLRSAAHPLDMGNSGTAMRLFAGLLAGQAFDSVLVGDESLSKRPMERVARPLRNMGASIETTEGCAPLRVYGGRKLTGIRYDMPIASAQVKSALLLAAMYANGETIVREPAVTRDHTERMLTAFGYPVTRTASGVRIAGGGELRATPIAVPGDLSSAAFFLLAGCNSSREGITIANVGLNPTRTGVIDILRLMGADLTVEQDKAASGGEPFGRITVRPSQLHGIVIPEALVPLAIDEFPVVFAAAALAKGETTVRGAAELRTKESDRIRVMAEGLRRLGIVVDEQPDGARIFGGRLHGGEIDSHGDHRIAMAFAVAGIGADGPIHIRDTANVATSFPDFVALARRVGIDLDEVLGV